MFELTRRQALLSAFAGAVIPRSLSGLKKSLRVAHMTDFHCQPELGAPLGTEMALRHAMQQKPDLMLMGGDLIMDGFAQNEARTMVQWQLYHERVNQEVRIPKAFALGNHDVWGWDTKASGTTGTEANWGKGWFLKACGQSRTYRSFDQAGWHFLILDNILRTPDGYNGFVDEEQMEWLREDLAKGTKPTLILSHIPILSITSVATGYDAKSGDWTVGGDVMTKNSDALRALFKQHPRVKICLSGHTHLLDRVDYDGVSYLCGGAVCGAWWKGPNGPFAPGYRLLDLDDDGTFSERYVPWGWHERLA